MVSTEISVRLAGSFRIAVVDNIHGSSATKAISAEVEVELVSVVAKGVAKGVLDRNGWIFSDRSIESSGSRLLKGVVRWRTNCTKG